MLISVAISLVALFCLAPAVLLVSGSLTDEQAITRNGFSLIPSVFSTAAYRYLFMNFERIASGYRVTMIVTVAGTAFSLLVTALMAYPLSRKDVKFRNPIAFFAYFTMLFNGGMVPWYIICTRYLGLKDSLAALILPYSINAWNMFLLRNYYRSIPAEMHESAKMDGAGELATFFRIIAPLSAPGTVTVGLFIALGFWNDWWLGLMLINKEALFPLQLLLRRIISSIQFLRNLPPQAMVSSAQLLPSESVKMATAVLTIGPIIFVYPFVQRYFIKGIMIGAIKG